MDDKRKQIQQGQIEIELPEDEAQGTYSNLVMIAHSPSEFIFDFVMPGAPKAKVVKRMVLTPDHAKRLANALNENIQKYEQEHGQISGDEKVDIPFNYRGPKPEA